MNEWMRVVEKEMGRVVRRLGGLVRRGVITLASAAHTVQVEGLTGERYHDVPLWQQYGFASRPPAGGDAMMIAPEGRGELAVAVATSDRSQRPTDLESGEAVMYGPSASQGQVRCRADGTIDLLPYTGKTVNVGGPTGAELMLLGETVTADVVTFATGLTPTNLSERAAALVTAAAGWLASKGKVV